MVYNIKYAYNFLRIYIYTDTLERFQIEGYNVSADDLDRRQRACHDYQENFLGVVAQIWPIAIKYHVGNLKALRG